MKITTLVLTLCAVASLQAQNSIRLVNTANSATIQANQQVYAATVAGDTHSIDIDVVNTSSSAQSYSVKRYDMARNTDGTFTATPHFCFAGRCFQTSTFESDSPLNLNPGQAATDLNSKDPNATRQTLMVELDETTKLGYSEVRYTVKNLNISADSLQFTVRYNDAAMGIVRGATFENKIRLQANVVTGNAILLLDLNKQTPCKIAIFNALGTQVFSTSYLATAGNTSTALETENLGPGIYFVRVEAGSEPTLHRLVLH